MGEQVGSAHADVPVGLWRNRNLLILVGGQWVSQVGNQLFFMAVYWMVLSLTGSRSDLGFVGGILGLASVFGLVAGALVDRWDRRATMVWVDVGRAILAFALFGAARANHLPVVALVALVFVLGLGSQLFNPAASALLPAVVADQDLNAANSMNQSAAALSQLAGASLGGFILGLLGPVVLFGLNGVSFAASVVSLTLLRLGARSPVARQAAHGIRAAVRALANDVAQGQRVIWRSPFLRRALPLALLANFAFAPVAFLDVAWVRQVLHAGAFVYGLFGIAVLLGVVAGSAVASNVGRRLSLRAALATTACTAGLCIVALSRIPSVLPDLLCLAGFGVCGGVLETMVTWSVQRAVPDGLRGRVFGTLGAVSTIATPLGGLITGLLAGAFSLGTLFAAAGALIVAATVLTVGMPAQAQIIEVQA